MKTDTENKQDDIQNASAVRDCPDSPRSRLWPMGTLDKAQESVIGLSGELAVVKAENRRLKRAIHKAGIIFCGDKSDGQAAAEMFNALREGVKILSEQQEH